MRYLKCVLTLHEGRQFQYSPCKMHYSKHLKPNISCTSLIFILHSYFCIKKYMFIWSQFVFSLSSVLNSYYSKLHIAVEDAVWQLHLFASCMVTHSLNFQGNVSVPFQLVVHTELDNLNALPTLARYGYEHLPHHVKPFSQQKHFFYFFLKECRLIYIIPINSKIIPT